MINPIANDVKNHLEFLGYSVETEEHNGVDALLCQHPSRSNVIVRIISSLILVRARYYTKPIPESITLCKLFNDINASAVTTKWYFGVQQERPELPVNIECSTFGYHKEHFGSLLEQLEKEIHDDLPKFINYEEPTQPV